MFLNWFFIFMKFMLYCIYTFIIQKGCDLILMSRNYLIITDNTCDLPEKICSEFNLKTLNLSYSINGTEYGQDNLLPLKDFYAKMRAGEKTKTSQVTPENAEIFLEKYVSQGIDILYIGFSSGLSGTYNSVRIALQNLHEKYPDVILKWVDSLCASTGEGLFVYLALKMQQQGKSIDEVYDWCEKNKLHLCHMFTVDDLMFLHRGGRVSKTAAVAGSILGIKPILHVDDEGHLVPIGKIRGRKNSLDALVNEMEKRIAGYNNVVFGISHGDCLEDALYVKKQVEKRFGIKECIINYVGPVIGAHSGPGTVALYFLGDKR